jgi:hypothetical protein
MKSKWFIDENKQGEDIMKCTKCGNKMNSSGMDFSIMSMSLTKNLVADAIGGVGVAIGAAAGLVIAGVKGALVGAATGGAVGSLFDAEESRRCKDETALHEENNYYAAESRAECRDRIKDSDANNAGVEVFKDKLIDRHICAGCKYMFFA